MKYYKKMKNKFQLQMDEVNIFLIQFDWGGVMTFKTLTLYFELYWFEIYF